MKKQNLRCLPLHLIQAGDIECMLFQGEITAMYLHLTSPQRQPNNRYTTTMMNLDGSHCSFVATDVDGSIFTHVVSL